MSAVSRAAARLVTTDPADSAAQAAARTALCLAKGLTDDDIDPVTGHDLSRRAYEVARDSWRELAAGQELSPYMRDRYEAARAFWAERRPAWVESDNWLAVDPVQACHDKELKAGHPTEAHLVDDDAPFYALATRANYTAQEVS